MTLIDRIRATIQKRATYKKTLTEIRALPLDVALDLDIYPPDARQIAYDRVYGPEADQPRSRA